MVCFPSSAAVGKMPATFVSDEMLEVIRKNEQESIDKLLSQYIAFCGKVNCGFRFSFLNIVASLI